MASGNNTPTDRQPISPATRRRLQQCFEHGNKAASRGDFDYAIEMLSMCVAGDPGNKLYVQTFIGNLQRKYGNNKKGSRLASISGAPQRTLLNKSQMQKDHKGVLEAGWKLLKLNPWDTSTLAAMAAAAHALEQDDSQLVFLKSAVEANLNDPELNRLYGRALADQGQFDQAMICWKRVAQAKPQDDEADRALRNLAVEKTIHKAGYETAESSKQVKADPVTDALQSYGEVAEVGVLTPERQLERQIQKNPADVRNYVKLFELHYGRQNYPEAERWLTKAVDVSGGDVNLREQLEDLKLRQQREHLHVAKRRAEQEKTEESRQLYARLAADVNRTELEVFQARSDRYPQNLGLRYELGLRLQRTGNYTEAIKQFQEARNDPNRRGAVMLALGECFYRIKQYKLAMTNFEAATRELTDREPEQRKQAFYYAGCLAMSLKDWEKADHFLHELAGMDFTYKDVAERLDKIAQERDKG